MGIAITFKEPLHRLPDGMSPGGAVFPDSVIRSVDDQTNTLNLLPPQRIEIEGSSMRIYFEECIIYLRTSMVAEVSFPD